MPKTSVKAKAPKSLKQAHFLRAWRLSKGKTLNDVAALVGLSPEQISKVETFQPGHGYRQATLEAFAAVYQCEPADLLRPPGPDDDLLTRLRALPPDKRRAVERVINALAEEDAA